MKLTDRELVLVNSQHYTTNRKWILFDWKSFHLCIRKRHLDDPPVHHGTHDRLGIRFQHLHTFLERPEHYHNWSWFRAPHDKRDNRVPVRLEFSANSVHLYACDAVVQCIELDKLVPDDKRAPVDTMIQMTKKNSHEPKQSNKEKYNENSKRLITLTTHSHKVMRSAFVDCITVCFKWLNWWSTSQCTANKNAHNLI